MKADAPTTWELLQVLWRYLRARPRGLLVGLACLVAAIPWIHAPQLEDQSIRLEPWAPAGYLDASIAFAMAVAVIALLRRWIWLDSLSRATRIAVPGVCVVVGVLAGWWLQPVVGAFIVLGLTAQVLAGVTWSERCHAIRPGARWARPVWAVLGSLTPLAMLAGNIAPFVIVYDLQQYEAVAPWCVVTWLLAIILIVFVVGHHLRARHRALEMLLLRDTHEAPGDWSDEAACEPASIAKRESEFERSS